MLRCQVADFHFAKFIGDLVVIVNRSPAQQGVVLELDRQMHVHQFANRDLAGCVLVRAFFFTLATRFFPQVLAMTSVSKTFDSEKIRMPPCLMRTSARIFRRLG